MKKEYEGLNGKTWSKPLLLKRCFGKSGHLIEESFQELRRHPSFSNGKNPCCI